MRIVKALFWIALLPACTSVYQPDKSLSKDPVTMAEARIKLGVGYLQQQQFIKARQNFEKALIHAPDYYRSQLSMAYYYEKVGDSSKAANHYDKALRDNPKNGNVLNNYGTFLCKQGDYEKAEQLFTLAINQPYYYLVSASYENAGFCALKNKNIDKAQHYFEKAIAHQPMRPKSTLQLAAIEIQQQHYTQARVRLMQFHQRYGYTYSSLVLAVDIEKKTGNQTLEKKYRDLLKKTPRPS
ncbi:type IV pilus biogenesis/stability protein PilW [Vibrio sp. ZSDZ34]|jgi:type IV pilus assembly protein PilF|uniref:Type IV pilus biogenesis/stability protein PilW n=1 Tax=Vibrio gelatinilyticus TaxID=2893468 RepID=A0A9X2AYA4_9VIBR|nr:type IV pilus biogenesis/stability protein PilW [Vibrio gelatinilyticus]MCJ2376452.1 type IV pilus biogenesis/stability protein PilW [Vibrio gelatinilyticus]